MKKIEYITGFLGILVILAAIFYYQSFEVVKAVENPVVTEEEEEGDLMGYEDPLETVAYLMAYIKKGKVEPALRSCAIEDIAEYANLAEYLNYTEDYQGINMIPMVDSDAYCEIAKIRLASDYGNMIWKCIKYLSRKKDLVIWDIALDEPENPDGKYYQRLERISNILGSRDVCECVVSMSVDGDPMELHLSLAKYKRFWKVILFTPMAQYKEEEPDIRAVRARMEETGNVPVNLESYLDELLPLNYRLINSRHGDSAEDTINKCWIYLQRGDILSALTYFDFGNGDEDPEFSLKLLRRQRKVAVQLQKFYYETFLYHADLEWAKRHYEDSPEYIQDFLWISNMQYAKMRSIKETESIDGYITYRVRYSYDGKIFSRNLLMSNDNGWKIVAMRKVKKK